MIYIFFSNTANTASKKKYYFDILVHFRSCWESKFSLFSSFRNAFLKATLWLRSFLMTFWQTEDVSTEGPNTSLRSYAFSCYLKMWVKILFNCYRYVLGLPLVILWGIDRTRQKKFIQFLYQRLNTCKFQWQCNTCCNFTDVLYSVWHIKHSILKRFSENLSFFKKHGIWWAIREIYWSSLDLYSVYTHSQDICMAS